MVVFYNPRSSAGRKPILPLSLIALAGTLDEPWTLVDGNLADPLTSLDAALVRAGEDAVLAVTVMPGPQLQEAVPICREIKKRHGRVPIVWGGYFPTQHFETCLSTGHFLDYVIRGHGDAAFPALLRLLREGGDPSTIPGLAWRQGPADIRTTGVAPIPPVPTTMPVERFDLSTYVRRTVLGQRTLGYHSSYGCPFTCNFCAVVSMVGGRWNAQPAAEVARVVRHYIETVGADSVEFYDNNFFTSQKRVGAFAEAVMPLSIRWWGEGRVDTLLRYDDDTWRAMADSGLSMVFLGAESGSADTLAAMDKGGTLRPEHTLQLVAKMRELGIVPELSFVLGNPPDPERDAEQTIAFVREVKRVNPAAEIILYLYSPEPVDGALYDDAVAAGFTWPESLDAWIAPDAARSVHRRNQSWRGRDLSRRIRDFERVLNAYYPTSTDLGLPAMARKGLRAAAALRWHTGFYAHPWGLRAAQKVLRYQRPETTGF